MNITQVTLSAGFSILQHTMKTKRKCRIRRINSLTKRTRKMLLTQSTIKNKEPGDIRENHLSKKHTLKMKESSKKSNMENNLNISIEMLRKSI